MRKILLFLSLIIIFCVCLIFASCVDTTYAIVQNSMSEIREKLYVGENDIIKASFISGYREKDYVVNGYSSEKIEFGVLTFGLKDKSEFKQIPSFVLLMGTLRREGELEENPYNGELVADIGIRVNETMLNAKIVCGDFEQEVKLEEKIKDYNIKPLDALKIAVGNFRKELNINIENNVFLGECYIKLTTDNIDNTFYYYVSFVNRKGNSYSVIIDCFSGEILAQKIS